MNSEYEYENDEARGTWVDPEPGIIHAALWWTLNPVYQYVFLKSYWGLRKGNYCCLDRSLDFS